MGKRRKQPKTYVLGDLHGAYLALIEVLRKVNFDYELDTLVFLGDLADGWGQYIECAEVFLRMKNFIPIIGNHDLYLMDFLKRETPKPQWLPVGGQKTIKVLEKSADAANILQRYFQIAKYYHVIEDQIFCHGGFNHKKTIIDQRKVNFAINRKLFRIAKAYQKQGKKINVKYDISGTTQINEIFIGHNTIRKFKPEQRANLINIDTGCGSKGHLTLMNVKNKSFVQSSKITKLYKM